MALSGHGRERRAARRKALGVADHQATRRAWRLLPLLAALLPLALLAWIFARTEGHSSGAGVLSLEAGFAEGSGDELVDGAASHLELGESDAAVNRDAASDAAHSLQVTVVDSKGDPVNEARVSVFPVSGSLGSSSVEEPTTAQTDDAGKATVALGRWTAHLLRVSKAGYGAVEQEVVPEEVVTVVLEQAGAIEFRCLAEVGQAPVGAVALVVVSAESGLSSRVVTGLDGEAHLTDVVAGSYDVEVSAPGYLDHTLHGITVSVGSTTFVEVPMFQPLRMHGRVVDESTGEPLTRGLVEAWSGTKLVETSRISSLGTFELSGLPEETVRFRVLAPGYGSRYLNPTSLRPDSLRSETGLMGRASGFQPEPEEGAPVAHWTVLLEAIPVHQITGTVRASGMPVAGAMVGAGRGGVLWPLLDNSGLRTLSAVRSTARTETLADGSFAVNVPAGYLDRPSSQKAIELLVLARGYAPVLLQLPSEPPHTPVDVILSEGARVRVQVCDEYGTALVNARVIPYLENPLHEADMGPPFRLTDSPILTDTGGVAYLEHMAPGRWQVRVTPHGARYTAVFPFEVTGVAEHAVTCTVSAGRVVTGVLMDTKGLPIGPAFLRWEHRPFWDLTDVNEEGEFTVYCDDPEGGTMTAFGDFGFEPQTIRVRPGVECRPRLEAVEPRASERFTGDLMDSSSGRRVALGAYELTYWDDSGRPTNPRRAVIAGGSFALDVFANLRGKITFEAQGCQDQTLSLEEFRARAVEGRVEIRL